MSVTTAFDLVVPQDVVAEVQRKSAQAEFESFCEVVPRHFSDAQSIDVYLQDDPDDDDHSWVVFMVAFPADADFEQVQQRRRRFYEDIDALLPHITQPLCVLSHRFA